ncbi:hypothetical protein ACLOJK_008855 [Asimina triloba]
MLDRGGFAVVRRIAMGGLPSIRSRWIWHGALVGGVDLIGRGRRRCPWSPFLRKTTTLSWSSPAVVEVVGDLVAPLAPAFVHATATACSLDAIGKMGHGCPSSPISCRLAMAVAACSRRKLATVASSPPVAAAMDLGKMEHQISVLW